MSSTVYGVLRGQQYVPQSKDLKIISVSHEPTVHQSSPFRQFRRKITPSVRHFFPFLSLFDYCQFHSFRKIEGNRPFYSSVLSCQAFDLE